MNNLSLTESLIHPLSLVFTEDSDVDLSFFAARLANWTGVTIHTCWHSDPKQSLCFETRLFCMTLRVLEKTEANRHLILCQLGLNDSSEDFRPYQSTILFLLFQVAHKRLGIFNAQIKQGDRVIADYFTEKKIAYDRLNLAYPISDPRYLLDLNQKLLKPA